MGCCKENEMESTPAELERSEHAIATSLRSLSPASSEDDIRRMATELHASNRVEAKRRWEEQKGRVVPKRDVRVFDDDELRASVRKMLDKRVPWRVPRWLVRAWNYARAKAPWMVGLRAPRGMVEKRKVACLTSGKDGAICEMLVPGRADPGSVFCRGCGCPQTDDSNLARKVTMAWATCPKGLWPQPTLAQTILKRR